MTQSSLKSVFFNSVNSNIRVIGIGSKSLFNIIDLSINLSNSSPFYLKNYYCDKLGDIKLLYKYYIDLSGTINVLNRCRKHNSKKLAQEILNYSNADFYFVNPERVEIDIYKSICDYFMDEEDIEVISNERVDKYYPDILVKKNNKVLLVIEINEHGHSFCEKRMFTLKKKLNCDNFLNVNPHDINFSTGGLLKKIKKYI
jgi:hypothetical protein